MEKRDVWKTKEVLKDMTWPERIDHIWSYYKIPIIAVSVGIIILISVLTTVLAPRKQVLFSGATVNIGLSEDGQRYLTDKLFAPLGGTDADRQTVDLTERNLANADMGDSYTSEVMAMVAQVAGRMLDYVMMDEAALNQYAPGGMFTDLNKVLTAEQIAPFADQLYTITDGEGNVIPVAIDISGIAFVKDCAKGEEKVYIAFPGNTERAEKTDEFFDWLLGWEND